MIKVKYLGYEVELESIEDVRELLGQKTKSESKVIPVRKEKEVVAKKKGFSPHRWTEQEMKTIFNLLNGGLNGRMISKDFSLRQRHSKGAISQMVEKVINNTTNRKHVSPQVYDLIHAYNENKL